MITVGVDPGITGAVGVLKGGEFVSLFDIPSRVKGEGSVKREIDSAVFNGTLREHLKQFNGEFCGLALERVSSMPGQGVSSVFSLGDSYGCCRTVLSLTGTELNLVAPAVWKRHFGLDRDKENSRKLATELFPKAELHLKKHADRAEALLIARWLWETKFA